MSEPLEAARAAVQRSDMRGSHTWALAEEVRDLRDAMRALIQHAEQMERRMAEDGAGDEAYWSALVGDPVWERTTALDEEASR